MLSKLNFHKPLLQSPFIIFFMIFWWIKSSKEQHSFEIENICNIMIFFTVTLDQFNASLKIKILIYFKSINQSNQLLRTPSFKQ